LPWVRQSCFRCGRNLEHLDLEYYQETLPLCGNCLNSAPQYHSLASVFYYQYPLPKLIHKLKFGRKLYLAKSFGYLLSKRVGDQNKPLPEALIPMPLHYTRQRNRGFNQSMEIARSVSQSLGIPILSSVCQRVRATQAQSTLKAKDRQKNVKNAFSVDHLNGLHHIAIIDDVVTTGSTVDELSKRLYQQGVKIIEVWCICRASLT